MSIDVLSYSDPRFSVAFGKALHDSGFVVLRDHPLSAELLTTITEEWDAFFAGSAKHGYRASGSQEGYFPPDPQAAAQGRDSKEFFQIKPGGRYPAEVSDAAKTYYRAAEALGATLLGCLQEDTPMAITDGFAMPLPEMLTGATGSTLRIQRYLPIGSPAPTSAWRALPHQDLNLLTVLPGAIGGGLQVRDRQGRWHDVPGGPESVIVNAGAMLDRLTDGYYPAAMHRVAYPSDELRGHSRYSFPLFLHPASEVPLAPGLTAAEFLREKVEELRAKGWKPAPGGKVT